LPSGLAQEQNLSSQESDSELVELQKEKLKLELEKIKAETAKIESDISNNERTLTSLSGWVNLLFGSGSVIVAIVLGFAGLIRYFQERSAERKNREEERFESIIRSLGSEYEQEQIGATALLPTFINKKYERFIGQIFNLTVGNLRRGTSYPNDVELIEPTPEKLEESEEDKGFDLELIESIPEKLEESEEAEEFNSKTTRNDTSYSFALTQALTSLFRESYPIARDVKLKEFKTPQSERVFAVGKHLNASGITLYQAFF
jgi:hypothetical protein